jgi:LAO/AO transport system kinase
MWDVMLDSIQQGDAKTLARAISLVENEVSHYEELMKLLPFSSTPVIGITGPPGAGKSTLVDAVIEVLVSQGKKIGVLCVDPSSPFNFGALLGDRIRMSSWYNHPGVFIRSLASRGALGGLHPKIIEICDLMKSAPFDFIIVETVGVGQSEVEVAGLADITAVVMVPEAGDEIQTMKAGLMEIADVFVVNKSDRPEADVFVKHLAQMLAPVHHSRNQEVPIIKTIASQKTGVDTLCDFFQQQASNLQLNNRRAYLLTEKAFHLIQQKRMRSIDKKQLKLQIESEGSNFNLYQFIQNF